MASLVAQSVKNLPAMQETTCSTGDPRSMPGLARSPGASKVMLKILQARLQQYMNCELPDVQAGLEKAEKPEIKLPTFAESLKKQENSRKKKIYFCFTENAKAFDCVDNHKLWKILQEMGILDHLTCLLRNLYAGQEATVRTGHGTTDWFQIGKGVRKGCILSPCLLHSSHTLVK